jgi:DNA primase
LPQARPLADVVWSREAGSGVFETPESRAELEARLRQTTSQIADESVRRHYQQDMRERMQAFFGGSQGYGNGEPGKSAAVDLRVAAVDQMWRVLSYRRRRRSGRGAWRRPAAGRVASRFPSGLTQSGLVRGHARPAVAARDRAGDDGRQPSADVA